MLEHYLTNKIFVQQIGVKFYVCNIYEWKMYSIKLELLTADLLRICVWVVTLCCWVSGCQHLEDCLTLR